MSCFKASFNTCVKELAQAKLEPMTVAYPAPSKAVSSHSDSGCWSTSVHINAVLRTTVAMLARRNVCSTYSYPLSFMWYYTLFQSYVVCVTTITSFRGGSHRPLFHLAIIFMNFDVYAFFAAPQTVAGHGIASNFRRHQLYVVVSKL